MSDAVMKMPGIVRDNLETKRQKPLVLEVEANNTHYEERMGRASEIIAMLLVYPIDPCR